MGNNNGNNAPKRSLCCASHWNEKSTWHSSQIVPQLTACPEGVSTAVSTLVSRSVSNSLSVSRTATSAAARVQHSFPSLDSLTIDFAAQFALQAKSIRARTLRKRRQQRQRQRERRYVCITSAQQPQIAWYTIREAICVMLLWLLPIKLQQEQQLECSWE